MIKALSFATLFLLAGYQIAFADLNLNAGEVNISVAGIFIDVDGTIGSLNQIDIDSNSFTVQMTSGQNITLSSADRRALTVSPSTNASLSCTASKSSVTLAPSGPVTYTITPETSLCTSGGSGGGGIIGGGGGGGFADFNFGPSPDILTPTPEPTPAEEIIPEPTPEPIPDIGTQPIFLPPRDLVPPETTPEPTPAIEQPIRIAPTVDTVPETTPSILQQIISEATQSTADITSGINSIINSIGEGFFQIYQGIIGENTGTGYIVLGTENDGSYAWDTTQPLQPESGLPLLHITEGGNYSISIISVTDPSVQGTINFSFVDATTSSQTLGTRKTISPLTLWMPTLTAHAAEPATITVTYPLEGEKLIVGNTYIIRWESTNLPDTSLVNIKLTKGFVLADVLSSTAKLTAKIIQDLRANPAIVNTVKNIATPASVAVAVTSATLITISASASGAATVFNLGSFFDFLSLARFYLFGLIRVRRRKPWGRVFDKLTGAPVRGALVQTYDADFKKIKDAQLTDSEGRFTEMTGIGKYYIKISKNGFQAFQTGSMTVSSLDQVMNLEIAISPDVSVFSVETMRRINLRETIRRILNSINPLLLLFGTLLSVISAILVPAPLNLGVLIVYGVLDIFKIYFSLHLLKSFGTVSEGNTGTPISLAVVRIFDAEYNHLLATKVSNENGRFKTLLAPGNYYITCTKAGFTTFRSTPIKLEKSGLISLDVKLSKA